MLQPYHHHLSYHQDRKDEEHNDVKDIKDEMKVCHEHLAKALAHHEATQPVKVEPPEYVVRQMVEEMTGLAFWWVEELDIYAGKEYVPDAKPWDVGPATRALADLCLVLFNSNEFVYVY